MGDDPHHVRDRARTHAARRGESRLSLLDAVSRADVVVAVVGCLDPDASQARRAGAREALGYGARFLAGQGVDLPHGALAAVSRHLEATAATAEERRAVLPAARDLLAAIGDEQGVEILTSMLEPTDAAGAGPAPDADADPDGDWRRLCLRALTLVEEDEPDQVELELLRTRLEELLDPAAGERLPGARGLLLAALGYLYHYRRAGNDGENVEKAIKLLTEGDGLLRSVGEGLPTVSYALGLLYKRRAHGVYADNLEQAIAHLRAALDAPDLSAAARARTFSQLGSTLSARGHGDRADNVEQAIAMYEQALALRRRDAVPVEWAWSTHNLAVTLMDRMFGDKRANLLRARDLLTDALTVRTETALPVHFAHTMTSLGSCELALAIADPSRGDEHVRAALDALAAADRVFTIDGYRQEWLDNRLRRAPCTTRGRGSPGWRSRARPRGRCPRPP